LGTNKTNLFDFCEILLYTAGMSLPEGEYNHSLVQESFELGVHQGKLSERLEAYLASAKEVTKLASEVSILISNPQEATEAMLLINSVAEWLIKKAAEPIIPGEQ